MDKTKNNYLLERQFREIQDNSFAKSPFWISIDKLVLSAVQIFAGRYMNPKNNDICRLLVKIGTGIGKTSLSLHVANPFIKLFYNLYTNAQESRYVFIIGFSKSVFVRELIKFPEFGIITYEELYILKQYDYKIANSSGESKIRLKQEKKSKIAKIKRRISNEAIGGMIKFYGYKELANNLFVSQIPPDANQSNIMQLYLDGKIKINKLILEKFKGSLIICDEAHQTYNSAELNIYGLAVQFLLDYYKREIFAIFLSATILNNKAREIVDNANFVRPPELPPFKSEEFFSNNKINQNLAPIYEVYKGTTIFLEESTVDYPEIKYMGEKYQNLDYLNFTNCNMSPLHEQTFKIYDLYNETTKNFMIHDMILPNPEFDAKIYAKFHPNIWPTLSSAEKQKLENVKGLFDTDNAKKVIKNASNEWKKEIGIEIKEETGGMNYITGPFLQKENLKIYSTKYSTLLEIVENELKKNPLVKFLIYHPFVKGSGILMIQEILRYNGFITYLEHAKSDTYSSELYVTQEEWYKKFNDRKYFPASMVTLHYNISDVKKDYLIDDFNKISNKFGKYIKFFIGAQKIKQSVDFKDVQVEIITHRPTNIPEYIQIKGRIYRRGALDNLPKDMKQTRVYTLLSTSENGQTIEVKKYYKKIEEFKLIQQIEYEINKIAINNYIFYMQGFKNFDPIGAKSFMPEIKLPNAIIDDRYFADDHYLVTLNEIKNLIKKAFVSVSVWTYDQLWQFCNSYKMINFDLKYNSDMFNLALKQLVFVEGQNLVNMKNIILFDNENYVIDKYHINGATYTMPRRVIVEYGQYFILSSIDNFGNFQIYPDSFLTKTHKNIYNVHLFNEKRLKINQNYIQKINHQLPKLPEDIRKIYHYVFLLHFTKDTHGHIMRQQIENVHRKAKPENILPKLFADTYKKLGLLGKNWYVLDFEKYVFNDGKWDILPYNHPKKKENNIIVGIIEDEKFKLRKPVLEVISVQDRRTLERGMVCTSAKKDELLEYIKKLKAIKPAKLSTKYLCIQILAQLIELEGISQNTQNGFKYLYFL